MKSLRIVIAVWVLLIAVSATVLADSWESKIPWLGKRKHSPARIVALGDSITDRDTYALLVSQALYEAGKPVPIVTNAGIGGDTIAGMRGRLDRDVIAYHPQMVILSAGSADAQNGVTADSFEVDLNAIVDRLEAEQISVVLMTTQIFGPSKQSLDGTLASYNEIIHEVGLQRKIPIAEVNEVMRKASVQGAVLLEADDVNPTFEGQRLIARTVLDALGYTTVPVPATLTLLQMPGLITDWKIRLAPDQSGPLTTDQVIRLEPDSTWLSYVLPEPMPVDGWYDQERQRGFAVSVSKVLGLAPDAEQPLQGYATITNDDKSVKHVYFNTGGHLQSVWLNGVGIYHAGSVSTGWHAGKERIPADLLPGKNTVVIESNGRFFLSVTDTDNW